MLCYIPEATGIWQWRIARKLHFQRPVPLGCQIWRGLSTAGISLIRRLRDFHRPTTRCLIVIGTWSRIKGQSLPGVLHIKRNNIYNSKYICAQFSKGILILHTFPPCSPSAFSALEAVLTVGFPARWLQCRMMSCMVVVACSSISLLRVQWHCSRLSRRVTGKPLCIYL